MFYHKQGKHETKKYGSAATFYFIARHDLPVIVREFKNFLDKGVLKYFYKGVLKYFYKGE